MILVSEPQSAEESGVATRKPVKALSLCRSIRIKADPRRVMNALTLAEYMEAWLATPRPTEIRRCSGSALDTIHLELQAPLSRGMQIRLRDIEATDNHLTCSWIKSAYGLNMHSALDIRIEASPTSCALTLNHYGFTSMRECDWHASLWRQSLANLRQLMEPITSNRQR